MTSYQQADPSVYQPADPSAQDPSMKEKAAEAVGQGREAAGQVAQSATERVQEVTQEAAQQARDLVGEARQHLTRQAGEQHRNLATNLRSLSGELGSMVERGGQSGTATELVSQARDRVDGLAGWLEGREPGDVVDEVRRFARRRPGTFLLGALAAGVVVGRLTRGAIAAHTEDDPAGESSASTSSFAPSTTVLPEGGYAHTTGGETLGVPPTPGYSTGGGYPQPAEGGLPGPEQGYGATSTYGEDNPAPAYPPGDYPSSEDYSGGYSNGGYPTGGQR